jgi:hypothetical protein
VTNRLTRRLTGALLALAGVAFGAGQPVAVHAATAAGTVISNAATATYSDGTSTFTTQSNTVTITVQNVTTATLVATSTGTNVAPNQTLDDKYTVTNTGNGVGTFAFAPTVATTGSTSPTITSVKFTPSSGSPVTCSGTPTAIASCISSYNTSNTVQPGGSIVVDIIYNDGAFVQSPSAAAVSVSSTLAAPKSYTAANNGGNTATSVTPSPASIANTIQADAILNVQKTSPALTTTAQNVVFTIAAANGGYFATQPLALNGVIGTGLPASGIVIADPIQTSLGAGGRWAAMPTIALANGATGTADLYYTTTPIATIKSSPASTTWVKITNGGVANLAALNAITGITDVIGVVSGGTINGTSSGAGASGVSNGPPSIATPTVTTAQVTITLSFTQKLNDNVTNLADSVIGNNAQPSTPGTTVPQQIGPNESSPVTPTAALIAADITNTNTAPGGSGYSQQTINTAITGAVLIGPGGQPAATGAFSYAAGATAQWESGSASTANDYTAVGILNSLLTVNSSGTSATYTVTTPASPGTVAIRHTLQNNGSLADTYTLTTAPFADTPTTGGSAWTIAYAASSSCSGATSTYTTPSVAAGATADVYVCWTPPANASIAGVTAYGGTITATSSVYGTVSDTTNDALFVGGYVTLQKTIASVTGTPSSGSGSCSTTSLLPGCVVNYSITYTNVLPKGSGSNDATPKGAIGFQLQEDGVNGVNAATGGKNTWGTYGYLNAAPALIGGPGIPTVTYFTTASPFSTSSSGAAQGALSGGGAATMPASCVGFRLDYPSGTFTGGLPYGANNSATLTFGVKVQ